MPNTPVSGIPYPAATDAPNVPLHMQNAVIALDRKIIPAFATTTARDAAIPSPTEGMVCYVTDLGYHVMYAGAAWHPLGLNEISYSETPAWGTDPDEPRISSTNENYKTFQSVTFTLIAGAKVDVAAHAFIEAISAGNIIRARILVDGASVARVDRRFALAGTSGRETVDPARRITLAAGTHTAEFQLGRISGSGSWDTVIVGTGAVCWLQVAYAGRT